MNSDFKDLITALNQSEVKYFIAGGYAVMFHGEPRFTKDLDIAVASTSDEIRNLVSH